MIAIDQDKLDGLRELIKLLLALTRAERPRAVYPYPPYMPPPQPAPPVPPPPGSSEGGMSLVRAAEIVERGSAHALQAIRNGTEEARKALMQLAEQRDVEQQAVEQVIEAVASLKTLQHRHKHQGENVAQETPPTSPHAHAAGPHDAQTAGTRRKR